MYGLIQKHKGIAAAIIAVASVSFLFWMFTVQDIKQLFGTQRCVAKVEDSCITYREFRTELLKFSELLKNQEAASFIKRQILSSMISRELIYLKAKEMGIIASDREVSEAILGDDTFKVDGKFSYDRYIELLNRINLTPVEYEESLKKSLTIRKFARFIGYGTYLTDRELEIDKALKSVKVKGKLFIITPDSVKVSYSPTEKELRDYYEKNKNKFKTKEKRVFRLWKFVDKKKAHETYNDLKAGKEPEGFEEVLLSEGKFNRELPKELERSLRALSEKDRISILKEGGTYYVLQFYKTLEPKQKTFEEVKEEVKALLIALRKREELSRYAQRIKEGLIKGEEPKVKSIAFDDTPIEQIISFTSMGEEDIVKLIFTQQKVFGPYRVKDGLALVYLESRESKEPDEKELAAVKEAIKSSKVQALINLYAEKLLKGAKVEVNEDYLK